MDYKTETVRAYNTYPEKYDVWFNESFSYFKDRADAFISYLAGKKIVDLGSGPGNHAEYFKKKGFNVLCIDISEAMIKLCKRKGLKAEIMDIEDLQLPEKSYDGIWANSSLHHIPKEKIPKILNQIIKILKSNGFLYLAVKEGKGQGFEINEKYPGTRRWFTYFMDEEIRKLFGESFDIIHFSRINIPGSKIIFLNYLLRLKDRF